jgi:electron transport complex protein RnfB
MNAATENFIAAGAVVLAVFGILMSLVTTYARKHASGAFKRIRNLLPGMDCGQCGHPGCDAYAKALLEGKAQPDACRPGGPDLAESLAEALGMPAPQGGDYDEMLFAPRQVAYIHASSCTGCGKCARACKVDAISGTLKQPHVVNPDWCISCGDCVGVCPEECIEMVREKAVPANFNWEIKSVQPGTVRR